MHDEGDGEHPTMRGSIPPISTPLVSSCRAINTEARRQCLVLSFRKYLSAMEELQSGIALLEDWRHDRRTTVP
jgi:hypothetical protein